MNRKESNHRYYLKNKVKCLQKQKNYKMNHMIEYRHWYQQYLRKNREKLIANSREYYSLHKEQYRKKSKQYRKRHKKQLQQKQRVYYQNHKDYLKKKQTTYCSKNQAKIKLYRTKTRNQPNTLFNQRKAGSLRKGLHWKLSLVYFKKYLYNKPCFYCGIINVRNGIDRINNAIGYTRKNSVSCCFLCNTWKRNLSIKDFSQHIKILYQKLVKTRYI